MPTYPDAHTEPSQAKTSASTTTLPDWEPVRLSPAHVEMVKQSVHGIPITRIAYNFKRFGVTYSNRQISRILKSAKGQEFASLYSAQVHGGIAGLTYRGTDYAPEALYTEVELMRNHLVGERHRLSASQDIMDRVGPPKISRQETENKQPTTIIVNLLPGQMQQFLTPPPAIEAETVQLLDQPSSSDDE